MRILIMDNDKTVADGLMLILKEEGHLSDHSITGEGGIELARLYDYDAIVMDISLPDMGRLGAIYKLRSNGIKTPIVVVSTDSDVETKVEALNLGADDVMVKPFHVKELLARTQAIVRRAQGHSASAIDSGRLKLDLRRNMAEVAGQPLNLTNKEYAILELLALRKGAMVTKETFLNHLYGGIDEPEIKIVDVFMCRLRKKISALAEGDNFIHTVWGRGYILSDPREKNKEYLKVG